jgi:hypothetical protein
MHLCTKGFDFLLNKIFPYTQTTGGNLNFAKFKICLNQIGFHLQSFQIKPEKREREGKEEKAPGADFSHSQRTAHGPLTILPESVPNHSSSCR